MLKLVKISDVEEKSIDWFVDQWIPKGCVGYIAGQPSAGKTRLSLEFAIINSLNMQLDSMQCNNDGRPFLYVSPETSYARVIKPYMRISDAQEFCFIPESYNDSAFSLYDDKHVAALIDEFSTGKYSYLIIDTADRLVRDVGGINDKVVIQKIIDPLMGVCEKINSTCILLLHVKKNQANEGMYSVLGSVGWVGACRFGLSLYRVDKQHDWYNDFPSFSNLVLCIKTKANYSKTDSGGYLVGLKDIDGVGKCSIIKSLNPYLTHSQALEMIEIPKKRKK